MKSATQDEPQPTLIFPSSEWTMEVAENPSKIEGGLNHFHANIYRGRVWMCRITLSGPFADKAAADVALNKRIRAWLVDYNSRPHTGETEFQDL